MQIFSTICEIIMIKVEKQAFSALLRAKISSVSNFFKTCFYFFDGMSSFYAKGLILEFMKKSPVKKL